MKKGIRVLVSGSQEARGLVGQLADLYASDLADPPDLLHQQADGFTADRFRTMFLEQYVTKLNFTLVTLWREEQLAGFVCGNSLIRETRWWKSVREPLSEDFTKEDGTRTVALKDMVIREGLRGQGFGRLLHDEFLRGRTEERVTLASEPDQQPAHSIWLHWGYRQVGTIEPVGLGRPMDVLARPVRGD